ncbi:MAG TPA: SsrA-binding protein SmpB [Saprospiraceae bacterium]|nr:SsrA-binding protein SmpB [Saprospiraceae bacterium]
MEIVNRKARHEYHMMQKYDAGIMLKGTEVKSLRLGLANMSDAWCVFEGGELYIKQLHINEYERASMAQHEAKGTRKLLLKKTELKKLEKRVAEKGLTIVPYRIYFSERGHAKCEIWLAQGKKEFDKRNTIKERDVQRDIDRSLA